MKRPGIFNKTFVLAFGVSLTVFCGVLHCAAYDDACPYDPTCGGESLEYFTTNHSTGAPISDGAVLPAGTIVDLDAHATAYGQCQAWIPTLSDLYWICILGDLFQGPVDHVAYRVYAAAEGPLNGDYYLGG